MNPETTARVTGYVNGTLGDDALKDFEAELPTNPRLRAELAFVSAIAAAEREATPMAPADIGMERALKAFRAVHGEPAPIRPVQQLRAAIASMAWLFQPRAAAWAAVVVMGVQFALIGGLVLERDQGHSEMRSSTSSKAPPGPFIKISIKPDAAERDIRFLIVSLGATIVGGPTQLGDYYLFLDPKRTDWAVQQLKNSQIVDAATLIATLPAVKE